MSGIRLTSAPASPCLLCPNVIGTGPTVRYVKADDFKIEKTF